MRQGKVEKPLYKKRERLLIHFTNSDFGIAL